MDISVAKVRKVLKIAQEPISLETPIGEEEDSHLGDFIEDRQVVSPAEAVITLNLKEQTDSVLKSLTPREEKVIKMRFGVGDGSEHTLEEVGQNFAVTRERIRQIEAKALRKLRHPLRSRKLRAFPRRRHLVECPGHFDSTFRAGHPVRAGAVTLLNGVTDAQSAPSARLATRAPRSEIRRRNDPDTPLVPAPVSVLGPIAQRLEPPAHNRSVPGSNPGGPTILAGAATLHRASLTEAPLRRGFFVA